MEKSGTAINRGMAAAIGPGDGFSTFRKLSNVAQF